MILYHLTNAEDKSFSTNSSQSSIQPSGFYVVPHKLLRKLTQPQLEGIYQYLGLTSFLPPFLSYKNKNAAIQAYKNFGMESRQIDILIDKYSFDLETGSIDQTDETRTFVFYNPISWILLNENAKKSFLYSVLKNLKDEKRYDLFVRISAGDPADEIIDYFSMREDSDYIRKVKVELAKQLKSKEVVYIPAKAIMPRLIRATEQSYSSCDGPNCLNTAELMMYPHQTKKEVRVKYTADSNSLAQSLIENLHTVASGEPLKMGDILVYFNEKNKAIHFSTFIGQSVVFTKNGFSRFSHYIFQDKESNELSYFPNKQFRMIAFRNFNPESDNAIFFFLVIIWIMKGETSTLQSKLSAQSLIVDQF